MAATGSQPGLPWPPQAPPGAQRRTTHQTWRRPGQLVAPTGNPGSLTRDVKEAQSLCLQGRPRGQLLPVTLHGRRRHPRWPVSVSSSLRFPARPSVYVALRRLASLSPGQSRRDPVLRLGLSQRGCVHLGGAWPAGRGGAATDCPLRLRTEWLGGLTACQSRLTDLRADSRGRVYFCTDCTPTSLEVRGRLETGFAPTSLPRAHWAAELVR